MDLSKHMLFQSVRLVGAVGIETTTRERLLQGAWLNAADLAVYKIDSVVDGKTENAWKRMVGASGFEPPASCSRTRCVTKH